MPNYLESTTEITTWRRANRVELINDEIPEARVFSIDRTRFPDGSIIDKQGPQFDVRLNDPAHEIPLIDPETYEPTEVTFTAGQFALMASSLALWAMRGGAIPPPASESES